MWFALLLACAKEPIVKTIPADDGAVELFLVNPSSCTGCDPFEGVDTIDLEVLQDGAVVAAESFAWPGATLTLPELDGFGVIRVRMTGRRAGAVVSFGQTPELAVGPGRALQAPLQFLPVNTALPITAASVLPRTGAVVLGQRDGQVLLAGGTSPGGDRVFTSTELYDPVTGTFADVGLSLPSPHATAPVAEFTDGVRLIVGGTGTIAEGGAIPTTDVAEYDEELGTFVAASSLALARSGACVSAFAEGQALVLGGHDEPVSRGELLRRGAEDGVWRSSDVYFEDLDDRRVTGCVPLADGRTFVQGSAADSTGIWRFSEANMGSVTPEAAFSAVSEADPGEGAAFVTGGTVLALANGDAWIDGGINRTSGSLAGVAREFDAAGVRFGLALAQPTLPRAFGVARRLDDTGTVAWGCGWRDLARGTPLPSVELFNVETGAAGPLIQLVDPRSGCDLAVLPDGSLLVVGGVAATTAEIIRPYLE